MRAYGRAHSVVNTQAFLRDRIFHKDDRHDWDDVIRINLKRLLLCLEGAALQFKSQARMFVHSPRRPASSETSDKPLLCGKWRRRSLQLDRSDMQRSGSPRIASRRFA